LIAQIRGNTTALRSQSYFNGMTHGQRPFEMVIMDPDLMRVVNAGYASPASLLADERERFNLHTFMLFNSWEYFFYQNRDGAIPRQLFGGTDAHMRRLVETKSGLGEFWEEYRHAYEDPFLSYVQDQFDRVKRHAI
jgi:hypothetical protein